MDEPSCALCRGAEDKAPAAWPSGRAAEPWRARPRAQANSTADKYGKATPPSKETAQGKETPQGKASPQGKETPQGSPAAPAPVTPDLVDRAAANGQH
jgi:hypothetical protein